MIYEPVGVREIMDLKKNDPDGYEELKILAADALNSE